MQGEARKSLGEKGAAFQITPLRDSVWPATVTMCHGSLRRKRYLLVTGLGETADWFCQLTYLNVVVNNSPSKGTGKCPF